MGLASLFQKKTNYFDKKITPQCGYCQFGKRTGNGVFCDKKGLVAETDACNKFVYSPLKRIPVKQLNIEGALTDEEMYVEVKEDDQPEESKKEASAEEKTDVPEETAALKEDAAPAEEDAAPIEEAVPVQTEEAPPQEKKILDINDVDAMIAGLKK